MKKYISYFLLVLFGVIEILSIILYVKNEITAKLFFLLSLVCAGMYGLYFMYRNNNNNNNNVA